jgi:PAS domain-containing protein
MGSQFLEGAMKFVTQSVGVIAATTAPLLISGNPALMASSAATFAAADGLNRATEAYENHNRDRTDAIAEALSKGIVVQDENGELRSTDDAALAKLGIAADDLDKFQSAIGDNIDELREYGDTISAANA